MRRRHLLGLIFALTLVRTASQERPQANEIRRPPPVGDEQSGKATFAHEAGVSVRDAWIREAPPGASTMAGYMELRNGTSRPRLLVAASSSEFDSVMIHRSIVKDGMVGMVHASRVELRSNANLIFAPGGYHLMLMHPKRALRSSDRVIINLEFSGGPVLGVAFEVRK